MTSLPMRSISSLLLWLVFALVGIQAQGPVLAWDHTGPVATFRVSIDSQPKRDIGLPDRDTSGRYVWELPASWSAAAHSVIIEACNILNVCTPSVTLKVPARASKPTTPTNLKFEQTPTGRLGNGLPRRQETVPTPPGPLNPPAMPNTPSPANGATEVGLTPTLTYLSALAVTHAVYFGTVNPPTSKFVLGSASFQPGTLAAATVYYWRAETANLDGTTLGPVWSFTTATPTTPLPSAITPIFPTNTATGVSLNVTLSCSAVDADTYTLLFGTVNPPTTETSLGSGCSVAPGTLATSTLYYWRIRATNVTGSTTGAVWSFTTTAGGASSFAAHGKRLFLTDAKLAELTARKDANTAEYQSMKAFVDAMLPSNNSSTTLSASLGTGGSGTTFTVADGSLFPTSEHTVRINHEALRVTRSGNTFTVVSRNYDIYGRGTSGTKSHASGATVWRHEAFGDLQNALTGASLLRKMGVAGYDEKCKNATNLLMYFFSAPSIYNSNEARHTGHFVGMAYDWNRDLLTSDDISDYASIFHEALTFYQTTQFDPNCNCTLALKETVLSGNVPAGVLRAMITMSAAMADDDPDGLDHWAIAYSWITYLRSALLTGTTYGGSNAEGSEYSQDDWNIYPDVFAAIASATNTPSELSDIASWEARFVKLLAYISSPGITNSAVSTTCSITAGSTTLTCADASTFSVGENIYVGLDVGSGMMTVDANRTTVTPTGVVPSAADIGKSIWVNLTDGGGGLGALWKFWISGYSGGKWTLQTTVPTSIAGITVDNPMQWAFGGRTYSPNDNSYVTTIVAKVGNVITTRDPAPTDGNSKATQHWPTIRPFGDTESTNNYDDFAPIAGDLGLAFAHAQDILVDAGDTTTAGYAEYILQNHLPNTVNSAPNLKPLWFLWREPGITPVNPNTLPVNFVMGDPDAFGVTVGQSDWTNLRTQVSFITGSTAGNHVQSAYGTYGIKRKGVWLTRDLSGYDLAPDAHSNYYQEFGAATGFSESAWLGARFKNSIQMNGHSGHHNRLSAPSLIGAVTMPRSRATSTYAYTQMDASNAYRGNSGGVSWTALGYPNNDALTWVRDFFYLTPDLTVLHDRTTYANTTTSPTRWHFNYPCDPSTVTTRVTCTYAGQKLVQDIKLPVGGDGGAPAITEVNYRTQQDGAFDGFRISVESGVSASTEYGLQVIQSMDAADAVSAVTTLTTTNANVVEVAAGARCANGCVIGFVKGTTPTLNITYTYASANPDHYLMGFGINTNYHVVEAAGTVTISSATGSGDTTANAAGMLVF